MPKPSKLRLLLDKKRAALAEAAIHEAALSSLRELIHDYEIAERVLASLDGEDEDELHEEASEARIGEVRSEPPKKPDGIPTMPDMVLEALRMAAQQGFSGLEPMAILAFIQGKYWPEATSREVGPTAWRMAKEGRLIKQGSVYSLIGEGRVEPKSWGQPMNAA